jgi:hypothetical protein
MHPDLESILSADEEARARVAAAERAARERLDGVRAETTARLDRRRRELEDALEREIAAILTEADREAAEIGRRRAAYVESHAASADALLDRAAETYAAILRSGPSR